MTKKHIKAIHFDIDETLLKKCYPYHDQTHSSNNYKNVYKMIGRILCKEGFEHRQYSGYISKEPITDYKLTKVVKKLAGELPWLKGCFQRLDAENVPEQFDLKDVFDDAARKKLEKVTLVEKIEQAKKVIQQVVVNIKKQVSKENGIKR